jgi:hypothetical protein
MGALQQNTMRAKLGLAYFCTVMMLFPIAPARPRLSLAARRTASGSTYKRRWIETPLPPLTQPQPPGG